MSTDEWIKKIWYVCKCVYIYTHIYTQCHIAQTWEKEGITVICNNKDRLGEYFAKWNKSEKDKYRMMSLIRGI